MTFAFIEKQAAEPFAITAPSWSVSESAVGEVRRAAAVAAAGADRRGVAQPAARAARHPAVRDGHALLAGRGGARGRRRVVRQRRPRRTGPAAARTVDFFDVKGVVETRCAGRSASTVDVRSGRAPLLRRRAVRRSVRTAHDVVGHLGQLDAGDCSTRAVFPATKRSTRSSSISTRSPRGSRATICAPSRCRGSRRSCATSRSSSIAPCLRRRFVALSVRRLPTTLVQVVEFDRYQGKGRAGRTSQPVAAPDVPLRGSHADRRRRSTTAMARIVAALASQHGANAARAGRQRAEPSNRGFEEARMAKAAVATQRVDSRRSIGSRRRSSCWSA